MEFQEVKQADINEKTAGTNGAPVKMIWMFVTLGLMLVLLVLSLVTRGGDIGRRFENLFTGFVPIAILSVGAGACLAKGSINLALPGIACMSGLLGALLLQANEGLAVVAMMVAVFSGAASGALVGLFTIQSGKRVLLVTALSSLAIGTLLTAIPQAVGAYGMDARISSYREVLLVFCIVGLLLAVAAGILSGLGKHAPVNTGDPAPRPSGGARFLWSVIAGALAGLVGIMMVVRVNTFQPSLFSGYNEASILPALLFAGALIPNLRHSTGEGICGGLAALFGGIICYLMTQFMYSLVIDAGLSRILQMLICILFLIPNLLIGKRRYDNTL